MGLIVTLIIGGVIGWLASLVMKTGAQMGVLANIVVGIIGAVLGFWLAGTLGIVAVGSKGAWIISVLGAVVLIAILKALNVYQYAPRRRAIPESTARGRSPRLPSQCRPASDGGRGDRVPGSAAAPRGSGSGARSAAGAGARGLNDRRGSVPGVPCLNEMRRNDGS